MKFLSHSLKLLWIVLISIMLATGIVALLPSHGVRYGVLANQISPIPWLFWILSIGCAFIIFEIVMSDLNSSEHI